MPMLLSEDAVQVAVWVLRTLLPCLLFWISFGPKVRLPWLEGRRHSRETLLEHRRAVVAAGVGVPCSLATLFLATEETAPVLFQELRKSSEKRAERERERGGAGGAGGGRERERERQGKDPRKERRKPAAAAPPASPPEEAAPDPALEERARLESLVNFVAFNRREQQRTFLPREDCAPPPPPRRPQEVVGRAGAAAGEGVERPNAEAQSILRGALCVASRAATVAQALYGHLTDRGVRIESATFELMVEACIESGNLQTASDFLMRMETSGHVPGNELLDRVMELYLLHKHAEGEKTEDSEPMAPPPPPPPPPPLPPPGAVEAPPWAADVGAADAAGFGQAVDDGLGLVHVPEAPIYEAWATAPGLDTEPTLATAPAVHHHLQWTAAAPEMAEPSQAGAVAALGGYGIAEGVPRQRRGAVPGAGLDRRAGSSAASSSSSSSSLFPAFCVPDEFAAKGRMKAQEAGEAAGVVEADAGTPVPGRGRVLPGLPTVSEASVLSADAAVFVPGGDAPVGVLGVEGGSGGEFEFSPGAPVFLPGSAVQPPAAGSVSREPEPQVSPELR